MLVLVALLTAPGTSRADDWWRDPFFGCSGGGAEDPAGQLAQAIGSLPAESPLQTVVDCLAAKAAAWSPGTRLAISVKDLDTGASASVGGSDRHVSASAAKAIWLAAALDKGIDPASLESDADLIATISDNNAAARVVLRVGPNRINDFMASLGMTGSAFNQWGTRITATNSPIPGPDNYFTSDDLITFLSAVDAGTILPDEEGAVWRRWLGVNMTPRSGRGGWLGTRLPFGAQDSMVHKAGWLPGNLYPNYADLNEMGIVQAENGDHYAVAILAAHGQDYWGRQAPFVEYSSCVIYRAVSEDDSLSCGAPGDPLPDDCRVVK